ncbi:peptidase M85 [Salmonella enterica]|nr:peptidase M85 [Salmonella enterica]ELZ0502345.1 peptidase M85 [Salmonella enterica]
MDIPAISPGFSGHSYQAGYSRTTAPNKSDNDYAEYVLDTGKQRPLSPAQLRDLIESVHTSVHESRSRLIDQHTVKMIHDTILDALDKSPTFKDAVSYGMHNNEELLGDIRYRNEYSINEESPSGIQDIHLLTSSELYEYDAGEEPIFPICEAGENELEVPYVSFGVAPDSDSCDMPSWQEGLIHEIIHHVTGSSDPSKNCKIELGPTEILARRVAQELGWSVPDFTGYAAPEREAHIHERNLNALRQAVVRHENNEAAFFERLDVISAHDEASMDFEEYSVVSDIDRR